MTRAFFLSSKRLRCYHLERTPGSELEFGTSPVVNPRLGPSGRSVQVRVAMPEPCGPGSRRTRAGVGVSGRGRAARVRGRGLKDQQIHPDTP